ARGRKLPEDIVDLAAARFGHEHVEERDDELLLFAAKEAHGRPAIGLDAHLEPVHAEVPRSGLGYAALVVHDEDRCSKSHALLFPISSRSLSAAMLYRRKKVPLGPRPRNFENCNTMPKSEVATPSSSPPSAIA